MKVRKRNGKIVDFDKTKIKNAILNGMPYMEICLINVINVSEANIMEVKTKTPMINISITCFKIYLSSNFKFFNLYINSSTNLNIIP